MSDREFLSEQSVAEFFDVSKSTVRRWVEQGIIPAPVPIGGLKRWDVSELRSAVRRNLDAASTGRARSADPDEIVARMLTDGRQDGKAHARRRNR